MQVHKFQREALLENNKEIMLGLLLIIHFQVIVTAKLCFVVGVILHLGILDARPTLQAENNM